LTDERCYPVLIFKFIAMCFEWNEFIIASSDLSVRGDPSLYSYRQNSMDCHVAKLLAMTVYAWYIMVDTTLFALAEDFLITVLSQFALLPYHFCRRALRLSCMFVHAARCAVFP
jgi:hypothetical protein